MLQFVNTSNARWPRPDFSNKSHYEAVYHLNVLVCSILKSASSFPPAVGSNVVTQLIDIIWVSDVGVVAGDSCALKPLAQDIVNAARDIATSMLNWSRHLPDVKDEWTRSSTVWSLYGTSYTIYHRWNAADAVSQKHLSITARLMLFQYYGPLSTHNFRELHQCTASTSKEIQLMTENRMLQWFKDIINLSNVLK